MKIFGEVTLTRRNIRTGEVTTIMKKRNLIVNQSGDAMAAMCSAHAGYAIRFMYFQFRNGAITPSAPNVSDDISLFESLSAPDDYLRVPIISNPVYDVPPGDAGTYIMNRATWFGTTAAAPINGSGDIVGEANGEVLTDGESRIYAIGLVASSGPKSSDLLFARTLVENGPAMKTEDYHYDNHWAIRFAAPS